MRRNGFLVLLLAGFMTRGVCCLALPLVPMNDSVWYLGLTHFLSAEQIFDLYAPFDPETFDITYPIGYPLFLDLLYFFLGWARLAAGVTVVQQLMGIGSALLLYRLGCCFRSPAAGFISALAYLVYFPAAYYGQAMMTEAFFIFLTLLMLLFFIEAFEKESSGRWWLAGLFLGLANLVRPAALLLYPMMASFILFRGGGTVVWKARRVLALGLPAVLMTMALVAHNGFWFSRWTPSDAVGRHLTDRVWEFDRSFDPEEPNTREILEAARRSGISFTVPGPWWDFYKAQRAGSGLSAAQADAQMKRMAFSMILRDPGLYLKKTVEGFFRILVAPDNWMPSLSNFLSEPMFDRYMASWKTPPPGVHRFHLPEREFQLRSQFLDRLRIGSERLGPEWARSLLANWAQWSPTYAGGAGWLFLAALFWSAVAGKRQAVLLALCVTALILPAALLEYPHPRYREPAIPLMLLATALAVSQLMDRVKLLMRVESLRRSSSDYP